MRRTSTNLSDGRELIYFDSDATARRTDRTTAVDRRQLEATATASEIRHDALLDEWVVIATHRQGRTHLPPADECPLCPSREGRLTEIPAGDYDVVSFENRFPSFAGVVDTNRPPVDGESRPGLGRCEVLCFTSDHETPMSRLPLDRIRLVLDAWIDRSAELARLPFVEQVFCFENRGEEIGVTLGHPHGQVYGYPFVTPRTRAMADAARRHHERTGGCLLTDRLDAELRDALVSSRPASTGWHSYRSRRGGRSRCRSSRADRCPTSRRSRMQPATTSRGSTAPSCERWTISMGRPCRTCRRGTRHRFAATAISFRSISRCSR